MQNFIPQQASHHFVFCYRKVDWQKVEYALVLRMMAHLKFKFEPNVIVGELLNFRCTRAGLVGELFSVIVPNTEEEDEFTSVWGQTRLSNFYQI